MGEKSSQEECIVLEQGLWLLFLVLCLIGIDLSQNYQILTDQIKCELFIAQPIVKNYYTHVKEKIEIRRKSKSSVWT